MLKTSRKYIPALVASLIVICLFIVGSTDLRYYFQEKMYTVVHIANSMNPVVSTVKEELSFNFDVERTNRFAGAHLQKIGEYDVSIPSILNNPFDHSQFGLDSTIDEFQTSICLDISIQRTVNGIGILSIIPLPGKENIAAQTREYTAYEGTLDNITVSVGGKQFHPKQVKYMITQLYLGRGESAKIEFAIDLFQNPDDFMNYVIKPQSRMITVTVSKMYLHEYELNPILKGVF